MRFWVGVTAALGAGLGIGFGIGAVATEEKYKKEYRESFTALQRSFEMARATNVPEAPVAEDPLGSEEDVPEEEPQLAVVGGEIEKFVPATTNPYHDSVEEAPDMVPNIQGAISDRAISYIDEEEYLEDDDRAKEQMRIIVEEGGNHIHFYQDDQEVFDWDERIGESILIDFYKMVPPGIKQVLFVRNHATDTDYEVFREMP